MSVSTTKQIYNKFAVQWRTMRDAIEGDEAIKAANVRYVPQLAGQTADEYAAYLQRATYFNATQRTLDALSGFVFSKAPQYDVPPAIEALFEDITLDGKTMTDFAELIVSENIAVGRVGILVDMPSVNTKGLNSLDVERMNIRPSMKYYQTENIRNWRETTINGRLMPNLIVLSESYEEWTGFISEIKTRYRELSLDEEGYYRQRVFLDEQLEDLVEAEYYPLMNGSKMKYIPFVPITPQNLQLDPVKSPLLDLAKVNVSQFRNKVDYEHALHFTALPTPYISGYQQPMEGEKISIGSTSFHCFPDPNAKMAYLEFTGQGLASLEKVIEAKANEMAMLGARLLTDEKKSAESTNTVEIRTAGERAVLISLANTCSRGLEKALTIMSDWMGIHTGRSVQGWYSAPDIQYQLNTDYLLHTIEPQMITQLIAGWQAGALSKQELFKALQKGEIIEAEKTFEEHETEIEIEAPQLSVPPTTEPKTGETGLVAQLRKALRLD